MDLGWPVYDCIEYRSTSKDTWMRVHGCFIAPMIMTNLKETPDGERTISLLASIQVSRSYPRYTVGLNSRYKRSRTRRFFGFRKKQKLRITRYFRSFSFEKTGFENSSSTIGQVPTRRESTSLVSRIQAHAVRYETVFVQIPLKSKHIEFRAIW